MLRSPSASPTAIETLHNMGVVHGALRPRNVMVLDDGRVKLMDVEPAGLRDAREIQGVITVIDWLLNPSSTRGQ